MREQVEGATTRCTSPKRSPAPSGPSALCTEETTNRRDHVSGPHPAARCPGSRRHTAVVAWARADSRGFLALPPRSLIALTKAHPNDLKHLTGSHKSKGAAGYSHNAAPPSPIVPGRGRGLGAVGGLTYLIHAAKWGNNVTNYEQAQSPACGILPFVSLHHVSAGLLG